MNSLVNAVLERLPQVRRLRELAGALDRQVRMQGLYAAGHFHSPVPAPRDVLNHLDAQGAAGAELPGLDLNLAGQHRLLREYQRFYDELPFPDEPRDGFRYHYRNDWFSYPDAIFLYCFLRRYEPRRIVEVGSGFSSAVMLDTAERFLPVHPRITCIEPDPARIRGLLRAGDEDRVEIIERTAQDAPPELVGSLQPGDLLFIDSSHVVKCGSDLHHLIFEVLPRLAPGVFVHFHDVFYPFEYPRHWLVQGRYWNEAYFLRAFLSYNREWEIHFFNSYVERVLGEVLQATMPLCTRNPGGSLYIRRAGTSPRADLPGRLLPTELGQ